MPNFWSKLFNMKTWTFLNLLYKISNFGSKIVWKCKEKRQIFGQKFQFYNKSQVKNIKTLSFITKFQFSGTKTCMRMRKFWMFDQNFNFLAQKFRFSPEKALKRDPLTYLPFGYGPRNCIASRYVDTIVKIILVYLLRSFKFSAPGNSPVFWFLA